MVGWQQPEQAASRAASAAVTMLEVTPFQQPSASDWVRWEWRRVTIWIQLGYSAGQYSPQSSLPTWPRLHWVYTVVWLIPLPSPASLPSLSIITEFSPYMWSQQLLPATQTAVHRKTWTLFSQSGKGKLIQGSQFGLKCSNYLCVAYHTHTSSYCKGSSWNKKYWFRIIVQHK